MLQSVQLAGFSSRDRELLRLFLRRPPRAGVSLSVVENHADLLIVNTLTTDVRELMREWGGVRPVIGIVERFERDAPYYQVAQDTQMLFSLAQAINRVRDGWTPPALADAGGAAPPVQPAVSAGVADVSEAAEAVDATETADVAASRHDGGRASGAAQPSGSTAAVAAAPNVPNAAAAVPGGGVSSAASAGLPWQREMDILVIDDSHFSREAISAALRKIGFSVSMAEGGEAGIRLATEKIFDVALVDFEMPGMRGPEVLRKLRALGAQAPSVLIMLTSRTGAVDRLRAKFAGCDAYLTKPTRMQEFLKTLRDLAEAGKLSRP